MDIGARVQLHGLSRTELNGLVGTIMQQDSESGRAVVQVSGRPPKKLRVKPSNLRLVRKCDGCQQVVMDWEGPAELEICPDCNYACCESCEVHSVRGVCRCTGSNFGRRPDGTPTQRDRRCICGSL
jgi:hypothetical protein